MLRAGLLCHLVACAGAWDDSNFLDWFKDSLEEVTNAPVTFEGEVPAYVKGTFVQTGPARFGFGEHRFTHMLDGYSKTNALRFLGGGRAEYTSKFLASNFMNDSVKDNRIARGLFVGAIEPPPGWGPTAFMGPNDNNYIKMRKVGDQYVLLSDTMIATEVEADGVSFQEIIRSDLMHFFSNGVPWKDSLETLGDICMLGTMAHGDQDPVTQEFTSVMGCAGAAGNHHLVFTIEPGAVSTRKLLAKVPLKGRRPSYMHALASTPNHLVLIASPLYLNMEGVVAGKPLGQGGLDTNADPTVFHIIERKTGAVRSVEAPGFIHGHVINAWEEGGDILFDLTWYASNNATTLGWMNRWFSQYVKDLAIRESWPKARLMRYRLAADNAVQATPLCADEAGNDDFEVPSMNNKLQGQPYCIAYMMQMHSYEYDLLQSSTTPGPMGAVGLAKRNFCTGERLGWHQANHYPSEVQFVPNPAGTAEDDGVLLGIVFDGSANASYFHVLDARTMKQLAKAPLPVKSPFLIHATYFPDEQGDLHITV